MPTGPRARSLGKASGRAGANRRRQWLLTFKDLPSDNRYADLGHKVRAQLEQALEQRRAVDRHEPRLDDNGITDVELLWRLLYTGFDNQLGNP